MINRIQNRLVKALEVQAPAKAFRTHSGAALGSSVGLVRKRNEDCCLVVRASYGVTHDNFTVAIVCDGLGGMSHGREAAFLAASAFTAHLFRARHRPWRDRLSQAIAYANTEVYSRLRGSGGTTLSAVVSCQNESFFCHVGDSRVYGIMPDRTLKQLSRDDTINALLQKQDGNPESPKDSRLLQFVGIGDEMEPQIAVVSSDCRSVLLTSDGAHDLPHSVLQRVVSAASGGSDLVRKLLAISEMTGGRDNASAILFPIESDAEIEEETGDCELLAILPNDTVSILILESDAIELSGRTPRAMPDRSSQELVSKNAEIARDAKLTDQKPNPSPAAIKTKPRNTKPRKGRKSTARAKSDAGATLPLDPIGHEVDIQFSNVVESNEKQS